MQPVYLYAITFITAFMISYYNASNTQRFRNLFFLIYSSGPVLFYAFCYGLVGAGLMLLLDKEVLKITESQVITAPDYLYAIGVGVSIKAISDLKLFSINVGNGSLPIGVKTFTEKLDKYFEERMEASCFTSYSKFLLTYNEKYKDWTISELKKKIGNDLRNHPNKEKTTAFLAGEEFTKTNEVPEILGLVLKEFGEKVFRQVFNN